MRLKPPFKTNQRFSQDHKEKEQRQQKGIREHRMTIFDKRLLHRSRHSGQAVAVKKERHILDLPPFVLARIAAEVSDLPTLTQHDHIDKEEDDSSVNPIAPFQVVCTGKEWRNIAPLRTVCRELRHACNIAIGGLRNMNIAGEGAEIRYGEMPLETALSLPWLVSLEDVSGEGAAKLIETRTRVLPMSEGVYMLRSLTLTGSPRGQSDINRLLLTIECGVRVLTLISLDPIPGLSKGLVESLMSLKVVCCKVSYQALVPFTKARNLKELMMVSCRALSETGLIEFGRNCNIDKLGYERTMPPYKGAIVSVRNVICANHLKCLRELKLGAGSEKDLKAVVRIVTQLKDQLIWLRLTIHDIWLNPARMALVSCIPVGSQLKVALNLQSIPIDRTTFHARHLLGVNGLVELEVRVYPKMVTDLAASECVILRGIKNLSLMHRLRRVKLRCCKVSEHSIIELLQLSSSIYELSLNHCIRRLNDCYFSSKSGTRIVQISDIKANAGPAPTKS